MKKFAFALTVLLAFGSLTGCIQMENAVIIEKDGSGTASLVLGITETVAEALQEMQALDPNSTDMDMPALDEINRKDIEDAIKPYDVELTKFDRATKDGREHLELAFAFKTLKGLSAAMASVMGEAGGEGLGIYATADGNYVLKQATYDLSDMPQPAKKAEEEEVVEAAPVEQTPEMMQKQMELVGKLMGAMAELDVRMAVTVPGDIIETNAPEQEGQTSIWTINSSNMMTADQDMNPVITFSGKGLDIKSLVE